MSDSHPHREPFVPPPIDWIPVCEGHLAIGHRPKVLTIKAMPTLEVTHVLTLLSETEGGESIGTQVKNRGLGWFWLPLISAKPPPAERNTEVLQLFDSMRDALRQEGRIYIHCSAGIHRTGMITYAFLRRFAYSPEEAMVMLAQLRPITAKEVGTRRKGWGEQFAQTNDESK